jgi:hypothetical protein
MPSSACTSSSTDMSFAISLRDGRSWRHAADPSLYWRWLLRAPREVAAFVASKVRFHVDARRALAAASPRSARRLAASAGLCRRVCRRLAATVLRRRLVARWRRRRRHGSLRAARVSRQSRLSQLDHLQVVRAGRPRRRRGRRAPSRALSRPRTPRCAPASTSARSPTAAQFDALILATDAPTARSILGAHAPRRARAL